MPAFLPKHLPLARLNTGTFLRICATKYAAGEPGFRAAGIYRFDDPLKTYGTLYCAESFATCYFETVVRDTGLQSSGMIELPLVIHQSKSLVVLLADTSKLRLVDLYDHGVQSMGLDSAMLLGADYGPTQDLSRSIYEHGDNPDGIVYRSRFNPRMAAVVLFDRAKPQVRLLPGVAPIPLGQVPETFNALTSTVPLALI